MFTAVLGFLSGVVSIQYFSVLPSLLWFCVLPIVALLWYVCPKSYRFLPQFIFMFLLGCLWAVLAADEVLSWSLLEDLEGQTTEVIGVVTSIPDLNQKRVKFEFKVESLAGDIQPKVKVLLSWYGHKYQPKHQPIHVGDRWALSVRLKRPHGLANPGGFDYEKWLFQKNIRATGYVVQKQPNQFLGHAGLGYEIDRFREKLSENIQAHLKDYPTMGLIIALVMGSQQGITQPQWEVMRATGTNHLMAIAGMHIGLVAGFIYLCVLACWSRFPRCVLWLPAQQAAASMGFLAAIFYAALAGFSLPTQRAVIMLFVFLLGIFFRRSLGIWQAFALAMLVVLLWDPLSTFSVSFWLSFGAVFAIIFGMSGRVQPKGFWWKYGRLQWVITLLLLPLCLLLFQQASVISFFANLIAVPIVGFLILPLALLGAVGLFILEPLGKVLLVIAAKLLDLLWLGLAWLSELNFAVWHQSMPTQWVLILFVIGLLIILLPKGLPSRYLGGFCLFPLFFYQAPSIKNGEISLTLLDVGQGLSVFVKTKHHALLFDAGPSMGESNAGERVILPFLKTQTQIHLDKMIISHADNDHIGGAFSILKRVPVKEILSSTPDKFINQTAAVCAAGQKWEWDGVLFEMLYPTEKHLGQGNNSSCVLKISTKRHSILLTGDIEKAGERYLIETIPEKLKSDILVAPHHGSKTSSTRRFVEFVEPQYVLYPIGYRNRYRFPHHTVVARYDAIGTVPFDTASGGALIVEMGEGGIKIKQYREEYRRFWMD